MIKLDKETHRRLIELYNHSITSDGRWDEEKYKLFHDECNQVIDSCGGGPGWHIGLFNGNVYSPDEECLPVFYSCKPEQVIDAMLAGHTPVMD